MAGLFTPGQATETTQAPGLSPAEVASRLFAIQLLLAKLAQSQGAPQTLGDYISSGPRKLDPGLISGAGGGLLAALNKPGAFKTGPQVTKTKPASPSLFQDIAGLAPLALLGYSAFSGGGAPKQNPMETLIALKLAQQMGIDPSSLGLPGMSGGGSGAAGAGVMPTSGGSFNLSDILGGTAPGDTSTYSGPGIGTLADLLGTNADAGVGGGGFDLASLF